MKYVITETQYKLITESNRKESFQELIDSGLESIFDQCAKDSLEVSFYACKEIEYVDKMVVNEVIYRPNGIDMIRINVTIYYECVQYNQFDIINFELAFRLQNILGIGVTIVIDDEINTFDFDKVK